jgi:hypothetical protein
MALALSLTPLYLSPAMEGRRWVRRTE